MAGGHCRAGALYAVGGGHDRHRAIPCTGTLKATAPSSSARSGGHLRCPPSPAGRAAQPARRRARSRGSRAGAGDTPSRESRTRPIFRTVSYSVLHSVYLLTPEPPGPGECAGSALNKPSRGLPDLYTRTARKTIVIGAPRHDDLYLFLRGSRLLSCTSLPLPTAPPPPPAPGPRPRGCPRGRTARQAGRARRPAAGGKRRGQKAAGGPEKARWRTVSVPAAVRDELRESPEIGAEIPEFEAKWR